MGGGNQVRVLEYSLKKVLPEHREQFISAMKKWDGSDDVVNYWYDWDVLTMVHKEVMEDRMSRMLIKEVRSGVFQVRLSSFPSKEELHVLNKHGDFKLCNKRGHIRLLQTIPSKCTPRVPTVFECPINEFFII